MASYDDVIAKAVRLSDSAVSQSKSQVANAVTAATQADKTARAASKTLGDRWTNRINAMRRRAADRHETSFEDKVTAPDPEEELPTVTPRSPASQPPDDDEDFADLNWREL